MFVFVVVLGIMDHGAPLMVRVCQVTTITTEEGGNFLEIGGLGDTYISDLCIAIDTN